PVMGVGRSHTRTKCYSRPQLLCPAEKYESEQPLTFAFGNKPGELKSVKLVALTAPVVASSVKSNAIDVSIKVVPGEKPAAEMPQAVFEDDETSIAMLTAPRRPATPHPRQQHTAPH